jgi:hypothetical protein
VTQMGFEWEPPREASELSEVELDAETAEAVVALMVNALIALVRAAEESVDER